ncbi:MAG: methyltransferase domain-containing protein [Calditrichaeota bacterium]|nr:MAG: methyltransferase domain-containing protein [Calditrichota bacterium]
MKSKQDAKEVVRATYSAIAQQGGEPSTSCCGTAPGCSSAPVNFAGDYTGVQGYMPEADLGLGCGLPTAFAKIKAGDTVVDLGSGAGNDCFVARQLVGDSGKVIGVDMTEAMVARARKNAKKLGVTNVEFRLGEIEALPLRDDLADVVISNCVLNLVPDKVQAFSEIYRVLKPGGHFTISDIVTRGPLPASLREVAELYAGCVAGALEKEAYVGHLLEAGFKNVRVEKEQTLTLPPDLLAKYVPEQAVTALARSDVAILSITVYGEKPAR